MVYLALYPECGNSFVSLSKSFVYFNTKGIEVNENTLLYDLTYGLNIFASYDIEHKRSCITTGGSLFDKTIEPSEPDVICF